MRTMIVLAALVIGGLAAATPSVGAPQAERGRDLVEVLGACGNCHSPKAPGGEAPGKHLAGGFEISQAFGVAFTSNITPDAETGIGKVSASGAVAYSA